jgi:hypothetical protein
MTSSPRKAPGRRARRLLLPGRLRGVGSRLACRSLGWCWCCCFAAATLACRAEDGPEAALEPIAMPESVSPGERVVRDRLAKHAEFFDLLRDEHLLQQAGVEADEAAPYLETLDQGWSRTQAEYDDLAREFADANGDRAAALMRRLEEQASAVRERIAAAGARLDAAKFTRLRVLVVEERVQRYGLGTVILRDLANRAGIGRDQALRLRQLQSELQEELRAASRELHRKYAQRMLDSLAPEQRLLVEDYLNEGALR